MYLHLFHGRKDPKQQMDDWGFDGPTFGPVEVVQTTYAGHVKLIDDDSVMDLRVDGDMLYYDGAWYGDWAVLEDAPNAVVEYDESKSYPPITADDAAEMEGEA